MIYIEEVTDSDDEKELIEEDKNDNENDNSSTGTSVPHNIITDATATANSSVSPPPLLFQMEHLPSCPTIIGGGSAIVTAAFLGEITTFDAVCSKRLVYVFGGCDRSGSGGLSNRLHCFDFGEFLFCFKNKMLLFISNFKLQIKNYHKLFTNHNLKS